MRTPKPVSAITTVGFKPRDTRLAVEAMSIDELRNRAPLSHFETLQRADFYRLIGVLRGETELMVDFSNMPAQTGSWLLVRPGQVFRYDFSRNWAGWLLVFRPDSLAVTGRSRAGDEFDLLRRVDDLPSLRTLGPAQHDWMNHSLEQLRRDGALTADAALRNDLLRLQLASTLLRLSMWQSTDADAKKDDSGTRDNFTRFRKLLDTEFATQHQVQHYANVLGMSDKTLSRVCLAATGAPAKTVINQRLVLEAKRLLAHTTLAVQTVGRDLGFDEATNFVKFFRKEAGLTPQAFRMEITKPRQ